MRKNGKWILAALPLALGGCDTITGWAYDIGDHMPTIGERCEHWQCFTESGQMQSDYKKNYRQQATQGGQQQPAAAGAQGQQPMDPQAAERERMYDEYYQDFQRQQMQQNPQQQRMAKPNTSTPHSLEHEDEERAFPSSAY